MTAPVERQHYNVTFTLLAVAAVDRLRRGGDRVGDRLRGRAAGPRPVRESSSDALAEAA